MPVDMQVPKKIPVGKKAKGDFTRVVIDKQEDGSYKLTAMKDGSDTTAEGSFKSINDVDGFVHDKLGETTKARGAVAGVMDEKLGDMASRSQAVQGESKRRPTRPAGDSMAPAYAEVQTNTAPEEETPF